MACAPAAKVAKLTKLTAAESCQSTSGRVMGVTGTAGFVGFSCAMAMKKRGDGVIGIDNFNSYYPVGLKRDRAATLERAGVLTLAAQAGVRYATKHPQPYVSSNIAGFVELLE